MKLRYLGYACQNLSIGCTTGRTLRLASLSAERVRETVEANLQGLLDILQWNVSQGIYFFRVSSDVIPFASHERFPLDWQCAFEAQFRRIRAYLSEQGVRLTMHPGQYTVLNSPRPEVVSAAIAELEYQAAFLDAVDASHGTLTLHVGGAYGDKTAAIEQFEQNFVRLSDAVKGRLSLENDDKVYHIDDVLPLCERLGLPMVFDYFHHRCHHPGRFVDEDLIPRLERVAATWKGRPPKFHLSSQKPGTKTSHADFIEREDLDHFLGIMDQAGAGEPFDLMIEAKQKDLAVLQHLATLTSTQAEIPAP